GSRQRGQRRLHAVRRQVLQDGMPRVSGRKIPHHRRRTPQPVRNRAQRDRTSPNGFSGDGALHRACLGRHSRLRGRDCALLSVRHFNEAGAVRLCRPEFGLPAFCRRRQTGPVRLRILRSFEHCRCVARSSHHTQDSPRGFRVPVLGGCHGPHPVAIAVPRHCNVRFARLEAVVEQPMDRFRIQRGWSAGLACLLLSTSIGWSGALGVFPARGQTTSTIDVAKMQLTFNEDFNELDVSPWGPNTRWIAHTPWAGDFGDARFADPQKGVFPFTIENGMLRIEARKDQNGKWQSGLLASADPSGRGFSQQYGYFEMRAKLPPGKGVWPAFWLANIKDLKASTSVEIDIMEYYGHNPRDYQITTHSWALAPTAKPQHARRFVDVPANFLTEDFHTYG